MANEEQEINRPSETPAQVTDTPVINTPENTTTNSQETVGGSDATTERPETGPSPDGISATEPPVEASASTADDLPAESETQSIVNDPSADVHPDADVITTIPTASTEVTSLESTPIVEAPTAVTPVDQSIDAAPEETAPTAATDQLPDDSVASTDDEPTADAPAVVTPVDEPAVSDEITAQYADVPDEVEEEIAAQPAADYSQFSKEDFVNLLQSQLSFISASSVTPGDFKRADQVLKEVKPLFDQMKRAEREVALQAYIAATESEEGFEYKHDESVQQFDDLYKQIKSQKNNYFQNLDKAKDTNFASKTDLLTRLRELVETDENNAGDPKTSWNEFKKIQDDWKAAGNMNSPHNATLWATYHALVDRYYSNRNIYFELKELDRKRNISLKTEVIERVEGMAKASEETPVTRQTIDEANAPV